MHAPFRFLRRARDYLPLAFAFGAGFAGGAAALGAAFAAGFGAAAAFFGAAMELPLAFGCRQIDRKLDSHSPHNCRDRVSTASWLCVRPILSLVRSHCQGPEANGTELIGLSHLQSCLIPIDGQTKHRAPPCLRSRYRLPLCSLSWNEFVHHRPESMFNPCPKRPVGSRWVCRKRSDQPMLLGKPV